MAQHDFGDELLWWSMHGVTDPFYLALRYNAQYKLETGKDPTEDTARKRPAVAREKASDAPVSKRRPRKRTRPRPAAAKAGPKQKIAQRKVPWAKGRKIQSRGFK